MLFIEKLNDAYFQTILNVIDSLAGLANVSFKIIEL